MYVRACTFGVILSVCLRVCPVYSFIGSTKDMVALALAQRCWSTRVYYHLMLHECVWCLPPKVPFWLTPIKLFSLRLFFFVTFRKHHAHMHTSASDRHIVPFVQLFYHSHHTCLCVDHDLCTWHTCMRQLCRHACWCVSVCMYVSFSVYAPHDARGKDILLPESNHVLLLYIHTPTYVHVHTHIYALNKEILHTRMQSCTSFTCKHTCMYMYAINKDILHARKQSYIYTHTHICTYIYTHIQYIGVHVGKHACMHYNTCVCITTRV